MTLQPPCKGRRGSVLGDAVFTRQGGDAIRKLRRVVASPKALRGQQRPLRSKRAECGKLCRRLLLASAERVGQAEPEADQRDAPPLRRAVLEHFDGFVDLSQPIIDLSQKNGIL